MEAPRQSVALLSADLKQAARLSRVFRKVGVIPAVFQDSKALWRELSREVPTLSVVDVRLLGRLGEHPEIQAGRAALAFFCPVNHRPLLDSTYDLPGLGTVFQESPYEGQIKAILTRLNRLQDLRQRHLQAEERNAMLEKRTVKLVEAAEELKREKISRDRLDQWRLKLELHSNADDFWGALGEVLDSLDEIKGWSALELSRGRDKLVCPRVSGPRFRPIPVLWPQRICEQGMEFFTQNMASQVALDVLGGDQVSLALRGRLPHPEALVFIQVRDPDFLEHFDWRTLERALEGFYRHFLLREREDSLAARQVWSPWELFSFLAWQGQGKGEEEYTLVHVDFSKLINFIQRGRGEDFYWKRFFSAFFSRFEARKVADFQLAAVTLAEVALVAQKVDSGRLAQALVNYARGFPYWRYFEQSDKVLAKDLVPAIGAAPLGVTKYGKFLRGRRTGEEFVSPGTPMSV